MSEENLEWEQLEANTVTTGVITYNYTVEKSTLEEQKYQVTISCPNAPKDPEVYNNKRKIDTPLVRKFASELGARGFVEEYFIGKKKNAERVIPQTPVNTPVIEPTDDEPV